MLALLACAPVACPQAQAAPARQLARPPNVVVVVLDDVGVDALAAYGIPTAWGEPHARTPVLDHVRAHGTLFQRAWGAPLCSPSRAMMLTGRHGFRTGMLSLSETPGPCPPGTVPSGPFACCPAHDPACALATSAPTSPLHPHGYSLPLAEVTLAEALRDAAYAVPAQYARGAFGKWHLAARPDDPCHPIRQGFEVFQGHLFNNEALDGHHFDWRRHDAHDAQGACVHSVTDVVGAWDAEVTAADARQWIDGVRFGPEPRRFFAWVAFNAPHQPFQVPPQALVSPQTWSELQLHGLAQEGLIVQGVRSCDPQAPQQTASFAARLVSRAALEAVDALIGRVVLEAPGQPELLPDTLVIVIGDNGTPDHLVQAAQDPAAWGAHAAPFPPEQSKRSVHELGVRVPLIVAGRGVRAGGTCLALVSAVDLWPTVLAACGADASALVPAGHIDGRSFLARLARPDLPFTAHDRTEVYAEIASRNAIQYDASSGVWSPLPPLGAVTYDRALLSIDGYKYVRRAVGADPGCPTTHAPCAPRPREELFRLFDAAGPLDPFETQTACGTIAGDAALAALRLAMSVLYTGQ